MAAAPRLASAQLLEAERVVVDLQGAAEGHHPHQGAALAVRRDRLGPAAAAAQPLGDGTDLGGPVAPADAAPEPVVRLAVADVDRAPHHPFSHHATLSLE